MKSAKKQRQNKTEKEGKKRKAIKNQTKMGGNNKN
jgi:hypothetical protein